MTRGFSLIELAFVLLIVAVLTAVGLPQLRPYLDRIATNQVAQRLNDLKSDMDTFQQVLDTALTQTGAA